MPEILNMNIIYKTGNSSRYIFILILIKKRIKNVKKLLNNAQYMLVHLFITRKFVLQNIPIYSYQQYK